MTEPFVANPDATYFCDVQHLINLKCQPFEIILGHWGHIERSSVRKPKSNRRESTMLGANFLVVAAFYGIRAESRSNLIARNLCRRKPHATVAIVSNASQCRLVDREFAAKLKVAPNLVRRKTRRFQRKAKKTTE